MSSAAEIQRRLLPRASTCEAGQFTLAGWLEPASTLGGDTYDDALEDTRLYVSMTDATGHDVDSAMLAPLTVGSLRNGRRAAQGPAEMAQAASAAIGEHRSGLGFVTGLLLDADLPALLLQHRHAHPRQLVQIVTAAGQEAVLRHAHSPALTDDATTLCLEWHGTQRHRNSTAGASSSR